jgi:hypothetical protein
MIHNLLLVPSRRRSQVAAVCVQHQVRDSLSAVRCGAAVRAALRVRTVLLVSLRSRWQLSVKALAVPRCVGPRSAGPLVWNRLCRGRL